jgi:hypothetical protein
MRLGQFGGDVLGPAGTALPRQKAHGCLLDDRGDYPCPQRHSRDKLMGEMMREHDLAAAVRVLKNAG